MGRLHLVQALQNRALSCICRPWAITLENVPIEPTIVSHILKGHWKWMTDKDNRGTGIWWTGKWWTKCWGSGKRRTEMSCKMICRRTRTAAERRGETCEVVVLLPAVGVLWLLAASRHGCHRGQSHMHDPSSECEEVWISPWAVVIITTATEIKLCSLHARLLQCLGRLSLPPFVGPQNEYQSDNNNNNNKWQWWMWMVAACQGQSLPDTHMHTPS